MSSVEARVIDAAATQAGVSASTITTETTLHEDLDLDSLDRIELAMMIEDQFGIEIPDEDVDRRELSTIGGLTAFVERKIACRRT